MTTDETPRTGTGIDRRSALKKAAVAGTIAWTAPTILSETAHAAEFIPGTPCTLKCVPVQGATPTAQVNLVCPNLTTSWAVVSVSAAGFLSCNCGALSAFTTNLSANTDGQAVQNSTFDPTTATGTVTISAIGGGSVPTGPTGFTLTFCVQCPDRSGDIISRSCSLEVLGTFDASLSSCSEQGVVGGALVLVDCQPPVCGPC